MSRQFSFFGAGEIKDTCEDYHLTPPLAFSEAFFGTDKQGRTGALSWASLYPVPWKLPKLATLIGIDQFR